MEQKLDRLIGESDAIWYHYTLLLFVDQVEDRLSRIEVVVKESGEGAKEEVSTQVLESLYKKAVRGNASA